MTAVLDVCYQMKHPCILQVYQHDDCFPNMIAPGMVAPNIMLSRTRAVQNIVTNYGGHPHVKNPSNFPKALAKQFAARVARRKARQGPQPNARSSSSLSSSSDSSYHKQHLEHEARGLCPVQVLDQVVDDLPAAGAIHNPEGLAWKARFEWVHCWSPFGQGRCPHVPGPLCN